MAGHGEPDGDAELELTRLRFPRRTFDVAYGDACAKRDREQRGLTGAELAHLRRFYPSEDYTQAEMVLTYQLTGLRYDPDQLPSWTEVEAELATPPSRRNEPEPVQVESFVEAVVAAIIQRQPGTDPETPKRGRKPTPVPRTTRRKVAELRLKGANVPEIMGQTGLSRYVCRRLVTEVDDMRGRLLQGRY